MIEIIIAELELCICYKTFKNNWSESYYCFWIEVYWYIEF